MRASKVRTPPANPTPSRPSPPAEKRRALAILDRLEAAHPDATCALAHRNPFELLVATILSAQCTDQKVNAVTPALFARYPDAAALAGAPLDTVEEIIHATGFYRAKAKSIVACANRLVQEFGGEVPREMDQLIALPGIGRKTANVVGGHAFGLQAGIAVDTHVTRLAQRLGLTRHTDPLEIESDLMALLPRERWTRASDLIIFHGRRVCQARKPMCERCPVIDLCRFEERLVRKRQQRD
ncbi:MAG: endonuclease III [Vicinamibacteria bacterium]|nr:endonuclease III [Vicinamibacteria bacterium]